jgi:hypothetical protein
MALAVVMLAIAYSGKSKWHPLRINLSALLLFLNGSLTYQIGTRNETLAARFDFQPNPSLQH